MQRELQSVPGPRPIRILGINHVGRESHNSVITEDRDLPWLQDTAAVDVWHAWSIAYDDVVVVGPDGQVAEVFNLSARSLSEPDTYAALSGLLRQAAAP